MKFNRTFAVLNADIKGMFLSAYITETSALYREEESHINLVLLGTK